MIERDDPYHNANVFSRKNSKFSKGLRAWTAMGMALRPEGETEYQQLDKNHHEPEIDRYAMGIPQLDRLLRGGGYGLTVLGGQPGVRKSSLALSISIEAACRAWQVFYVNAELAPDEFEVRGEAYLESHPDSVDCRATLHIFHAGRGVRPETVYSDIAAGIEDVDAPVLVVLDSINTLADLSHLNYLDALKEFSLWAAMSRRISRGVAAFLVVSELNKSGIVKGAKLEFLADVMIEMKRTRASGDATAPIELNLKKSRSTGGEGPLGAFAWDPRVQRFVIPADLYQAPLRVVNGPPAEDLVDLPPEPELDGELPF